MEFEYQFFFRTSGKQDISLHTGLIGRDHEEDDDVVIHTHPYTNIHQISRSLSPSLYISSTRFIQSIHNMRPT